MRLADRPGAFALASALLVGAVLLVLPAPQVAEPAAPGPLSLVQAWPSAVAASSAAQLADGGGYTPAFYLTTTISVGTALTVDGRTQRLLLRDGDASTRELARRPVARNAQFNGFTSDGDTLVWVETGTTPDGRGETGIWRDNWRENSPAVLLTTDAGAPVFFNSQYDLVIADGSVHWSAVAPTDTPVTEIRSVPLAGGPVAVRRLTGGYALTAWPWLVSAASGGAGSVTLVNLATGERVAVAAAPNELTTCVPLWCLVLVVTGGGVPARFDLMHPDGSGRHRIAGATVNPAVADVSVLDRFQLFSMTVGAATNPAASQRVLLYDERTHRTAIVADSIGVVFCRGGMVWWSTGDNETLTWHAVDLRTLG